MKQLYYSFVYPYFIYCIEIWGSAQQSHINRLIKTQKKIIRILTNSKPKSHTDILFQQMDILPFEKLVKHRTGIMMFKIHSGSVPDCISMLFVTNNSVHDHNTRANKHLHKRKGKCEAIYRTFSYQGIYIWNLILK